MSLSFRRVGALARARRGSMALEFAVVALPFITLLMFITELGYNFYAQQALDYGLMQAARQVQIGNAQGITDAAAFQTAFLCPAVDGLLPCANITVNVVPVATDFYDTVTGTLPVNGSGLLDTTAYKFCPGRPDQLMLVQAIYTSASVLGTLVPAMATATQGGFMHATLSSTAFINEKFPVTSAAPAGC